MSALLCYGLALNPDTSKDFWILTPLESSVQAQIHASRLALEPFPPSVARYPGLRQFSPALYEKSLPFSAMPKTRVKLPALPRGASVAKPSGTAPKPTRLSILRSRLPGLRSLFGYYGGAGLRTPSAIAFGVGRGRAPCWVRRGRLSPSLSGSSLWRRLILPVLP